MPTPKTGLWSYFFFKDDTTLALTTSFQKIDFVDVLSGTINFQSSGIILSNDESSAGHEIHFSFDGTNTHGKVKGGETLTFNVASKQFIWLKATPAGGYAYRFWAW